MESTARLLRSYSFTIEPNQHWRIEADNRRKHLRLGMPGESTFDMAMTGPGEDPDNHWMDGIGNQELAYLLNTTGEVHIRDTDNVGDETIIVISDYAPVFVQIA